MQYFFDLISDRRHSSSFVRGILTAVSYLYRAAVGLRHVAYTKEWFSSTRLSVPVISIGNIVVGGTGKTPLVQMLTRELQKRNKVAILSRGFKSKIERSGAVVKISSQGTPLCAVEECGDEPFCLGQETLADIWVGRDRVACGRKAIAEGAACLILDDGMQHRRLKRDLEIVVVDGKDPICRGMFLPRGLLRDLPSRLQEADLIVANHVSDQGHLTALQNHLKKYSDAPVMAVHVEPIEIESIRNKSMGIYCGIGRPERFIETLKKLDVDIVDRLFLLDHRSPGEEQLRQFARNCQKNGAQGILCTMKDWVKLPKGFTCELPIIPVKMRLAIYSGKEHWDALLQNIANRIKS